MDADRPRRYKVSPKALREAECAQDQEPRRYKVSSKAAREAENERERKELHEKIRVALKVRRAEQRPKKTCQNPCFHERCVPMPFMGYITWTDPQKKPDVFAMKVCCTPDGELATIHMTIPTRDVASIELRPARRPMEDSAGHVADGIRLAGGDPNV